METKERFQGLQFDRQRRTNFRFQGRLIPVAAALAVVSLLWVILPHGAFFWVLLIVLAVLVWMASYGWRPALAALISWLEQLEQI
jgi:hypothetical protein